MPVIKEVLKILSGTVKCIIEDLLKSIQDIINTGNLENLSFKC